MRNDYIDVITSDLGTFIARHNRWAELEAREILAATGAAAPPHTTVTAQLTGTAIERRRFLRTRVYQRFPLFVRPFLFWFYGYVLRGGFLDGVEGLVFHTLQRFWFRFLIDAKIWELQARSAQHMREAAAAPGSQLVRQFSATAIIRLRKRRDPTQTSEAHGFEACAKQAGRRERTTTSNGQYDQEHA